MNYRGVGQTRTVQIRTIGVIRTTFWEKSLKLFFLFRNFSNLNRLSKVLTYRISIRVDEEAVIVLL